MIWSFRFDNNEVTKIDSSIINPIYEGEAHIVKSILFITFCSFSILIYSNFGILEVKGACKLMVFWNALVAILKIFSLHFMFNVSIKLKLRSCKILKFQILIWIMISLRLLYNTLTDIINLFIQLLTCNQLIFI